MCDSIKNKKRNLRRRFTCVNSREYATNVVRTATRVEIVKKENKTGTLHNARKMYKYLKIFSSRVNTINNERTVTGRVTNNGSARRKSKVAKNNKRKNRILLKR